MKKLTILLIILIVICIGFLSGCTQQSSKSSNKDSSVLTKTYDTVDEMMNAIYGESLDFRLEISSSFSL